MSEKKNVKVKDLPKSEKAGKVKGGISADSPIPLKAVRPIDKTQS